MNEALDLKGLLGAWRRRESWKDICRHLDITATLEEKNLARRNVR
jgi:hypothetical protein